MCLKVVGVYWKERDDDGRKDLSEEEERRRVFPVREICVYIGRCWQHRKE